MQSLPRRPGSPTPVRWWARSSQGRLSTREPSSAKLWPSAARPSQTGSLRFAACLTLLAGVLAVAPAAAQQGAEGGGQKPESAPGGAAPSARAPSAVAALWKREGQSAGSGYGLGVALGPVLRAGDLPVALVSAFGGPAAAVEALAGRTGQPIQRFTPEPDVLEFGFALAGAAALAEGGEASVWIGIRGALIGGQRLGEVQRRSLRDGRILARWAAPAGANFFGASLTLLGDLDADGIPDLAIAAPGEDRARGAVYLVSGRDGKTLERLAGARHGDRFGSALLALGDHNGDGSPDLAIGAPGDSGRGLGFGSVRIYSGATRRLLRSFFGNEAEAGFGDSLALCADRDRDGRPELLIGEPSLNLNGQVDVGRVRAFSIESGAELGATWGQNPGDFYGQALAGGFDWNGDGLSDYAVGAPWGDRERSDGTGDCGRVEVRAGDSGELLALLGRPRGARLFGYGLGASSEGACVLVGAPGRPPFQRSADPEAGGDAQAKPPTPAIEKNSPRGTVALFRAPTR